MSKAGHNESVKMLAQMLHNIGVAALVAGFVAPLFAANLAGDHPSLSYLWTGPFGIAICIAFAAMGQLIVRYGLED